MKKFYGVIMFIMLMFSIVSGCSSQEESKKKEQGKQEPVELTISAAASLQEALNEIKSSYEKEHPNVKIVYNFGSSGALQQQISQGAPVDLFFSAAEDKFDQLVEEGMIQKEQGKDLLSNELVLVVPKETGQDIHTFEDLKKVNKLSIGTPESVPAGQYAKETLENIDVWKEIEPKVVYAKDVRQVLTYVETGNVDAGIVYKTDAMISTKVDIAAAAKEETHTPIIYPVGVIKGSAHLKEAEVFYQYLQNNTSMETFTKYGFKGVK
ncbi:molybdate ABC transporter substrate-binding protein [Bacillus sp. REN10]|uniref:molybdate ABC transporter substrate-binding protein n=1 Tax=Bacillus sp. REN10 TaxID=2782541 RepID=UPI00193B00AE|nr:molybdate ABC transporter substrate-binding protein [Bacillus sp. REN10]